MNAVITDTEVFKGNLFTSKMRIKSLGSLKRVKGDLFIDSDDFESLGSLSEVTGKMAVRSKCEIDWGALSYVGGYLDLHGNGTRVVKNDIKLEGSLYLSGSGVCTVLNLDWDDNIKVFPYSLRRTTLGKLKKEERILRGLPVHKLTEMANDPLQEKGTFYWNVILDELFGR